MTELEKPHIKTRADPGGLYKWYLLIIQKTDHFNFIHSLSDNINRKKKWEDSTIPQYYLGTQTRKQQEEKGRQISILLLYTDTKVLNKTLANWIY